MPRNSSGIYTLPSGNPVVTGTLIESVWANSTLSDVASSVTDSLDRTGRGAMLAPLKGTDGTSVAPAFTFSSESSTGMFRGGAGQLGFSILGVQRMGLTATTITFTTPGLSITGDLNVGGFLKIGGGNAATPGLTFVTDPDTGFYWAAADTLGFSTVGTTRMLLGPAGSLTIMAPTNPASPSIVLTAPAGGFGIDMRGRASDNLSVMRLLSNDYTTQYASFQSDATTTILGTTGAQTLLLMTAGASRFGISPAGNVTILAPTAGIHNINGDVSFGAGVGIAGNLVAANFYVGTTAAAAGTFGVASGLGASVVAWGNTSPGGGQLDLVAGGIKQVSVLPLGGVVNWIALQGSSTGNRVSFIAQGADPVVGMQWQVKGNGDYAWFGNGGVQLQVTSTAGATHWVQITGGSNTAPNYPTIASNAAKITIAPPVRFLGSNSTVGDVTSIYSQSHFIGTTYVSGTHTPNNRIAEIVFVPVSAGFQARFLNDAGNDARTIWSAFGGVGTGVTEMDIYTGHNDLTARFYSAGAGLGRVGIGNIVPTAQLGVYGAGQANAGGTIFDPDFAAVGGTLYLGDTGNAGGNGGCIMFGAFAGTLAGKHFASIKGFITDASGNTAGELIFNVKNTSADTGSTKAMRIAANHAVYDFRDLPFARDPGTAGAASNPIGSIIFASTSAGSIAAFTTVNAAASNLTVLNTSSSTSVVVNAGTWRNIGARDNGTGFALWIRIA